MKETFAVAEGSANVWKKLSLVSHHYPTKECRLIPPLTRRRFLLAVAASGAAVATGAQAQAMLDEKDPQAVALGYVADAKRVDAKKFPKYAAGQSCANCALYQGKPADKAAGCPLFGTKRVAGAGWCNAWAKKA